MPLPGRLTLIGHLKTSWNVWHWQYSGIVVNQNLAKEVTSARADKQLQTLQIAGEWENSKDFVLIKNTN